MRFSSLLRPPNSVTLTSKGEIHGLNQVEETTWSFPRGEVAVEQSGEHGGLNISIYAPDYPLKNLRLRWVQPVPAGTRFLGDHWERAYGDLEWRGIVPERVMPWYFLASDGDFTYACGVKTNPSAMCFWQVDSGRISLRLDLRSGGSEVCLGERSLLAATLVERENEPGESPFRVACAITRLLCDNPLFPDEPVYGANDYYYYTTDDLFGRWGFEMGAEITSPGWSFYDNSKTTAEIVQGLYRAIREAAGPALLIACNTFGHLVAGHAHLQRVGDDTSGRDWSRTRKMGVNSLAFRSPQQGAFFAADADCVGITEKIPWVLNRQWLDLLSCSGTALFVSIDPESLGQEQKIELRAALERAAVQMAVAEPLDWMDTTCPSQWRFGEERVEFDWFLDWR